MNKINPLYLLAFLVVILLIIYTQVLNLRKEINSNTKNMANLSKNAKLISNYKNTWEQQNTKENIQSIIANKQNATQFTTANLINLQIKEASNFVFDSTFQNLLNQPIKIHSIEIKRLSDENVSLQVEAKL